MRLLALDPATTTGWAYWGSDLEKPQYGVRIFRSKPGEHPGLRFTYYREFLAELLTHYEPEQIIYECPLFPGKRTRRANLTTSFGFEAQLLGVAATYKIPCTHVYPSSLKKFATGNGKAPKEEMIAKASDVWQVELKPHQDNEADALMLLAWGLREIKGEGL